MAPSRRSQQDYLVAAIAAGRRSYRCDVNRDISVTGVAVFHYHIAPEEENLAPRREAAKKEGLQLKLFFLFLLRVSVPPCEK